MSTLIKMISLAVFVTVNQNLFSEEWTFCPVQKDNVEQEDSISSKISIVPYDINKISLSGDDMSSIIQNYKSHGGLLVADEVYQERLTRHLAYMKKADADFEKFNFVRGFAKRVTLVWYDNKKYEQGDKTMYTHHIESQEELKKFQKAIGVDVWRIQIPTPYKWGIFTGYYNPPHGIIFETDEEKVFIGITPIGFHLGSWKNEKYSRGRLFYSPYLAYVLKGYVQSHELKNFPEFFYGAHSGEIEFQNSVMNAIEFKNSNNDVTEEISDSDSLLNNDESVSL